MSDKFFIDKEGREWLFISSITHKKIGYFCVANTRTGEIIIVDPATFGSDYQLQLNQGSQDGCKDCGQCTCDHEHEQEVGE